MFRYFRGPQHDMAWISSGNAMCSLLIIIENYLLKTTDAAEVIREIIQVQPNKKCLTHNIFIRYKTPITAIQTVIPIIAHHQEFSGIAGTAEGQGRLSAFHR